MKTLNITLLSELETDKHFNQAKKLVSQVGELFKYKININSNFLSNKKKGSLTYFNEIIDSCQKSEAAILCIEGDENSKDQELRNELGIVTRYADGKSCAIFEPILKPEKDNKDSERNASAYINCVVLMFDYLKISDASILIQKGFEELKKGTVSMNDYADEIVKYVKDRLAISKKRETENYGEILLSWGGIGEL